MTKIYMELKKKRGALTRFAKFLEDDGIYKKAKYAIYNLRISKQENPKISEAFARWQSSLWNNKVNIVKLNEKLKNAFKG